MSDFKLPNKWCVELKNDNWKILFNWAGFTWEWIMCNSKYVFSNKTHGATNFDNYTEITFEQFKTFMLKEEEFKVGDYVIADCDDYTGYLIKITSLNPLKGFYATPDRVKNLTYDENMKTFEGGFTNIQRKATQEEIDAVTKTEYTIEDLSNGRCAIINDGTVEELRLVLKAAFPNTASRSSGSFKYYYHCKAVCWGCNNETELPQQSLKTFLKQLNNNKQMEIIGYKLIKPEYEKAAISLANVNNLNPYPGGYSFEFDSFAKTRLEKAGVLDLWFEPVYKSEVKVFTMQCDGGTFELEVSSKGIYYKPESVFLCIETIEYLLKASQGEKLSVGTDRCKAYKVLFNKVDVGCKKNTLISEWKQVYDYYISLI